MKCLNNIGYMYNNSGDFTNGEIYLNKLVDIAKKQNDENMLGYANSNLAQVIRAKNLEDVHKRKNIYLKQLI